MERVHLVGIAGSGMLPLAILLKEAGYDVSGSDATAGGGAAERLEWLRERGITVYPEHSSRCIEGVDRVVASQAVASDNIEIRAARRLGIPVQKRSPTLAELIRNRASVCVSGSHGKSTTSAMLAHILQQALSGTGYMVGANAPSLRDGPAKLGCASKPFVLEACEAHGALRDWHPNVLLLTNVEDDHEDHYGGPTGLQGAFTELVRRASAGGNIIACGDDPGVLDVLKSAGGIFKTYGFGDCNAFIVERLGRTAEGQTFTIMHAGAVLASCCIRLAGEHNVLNAAAAILGAHALGVDYQTASQALSDFDGVSRRFQHLGTAAGVRIFDDFAHHPTEIAATISAARNLVPEPQRVVVMLQPQLHSRITRMADAFAATLSQADATILLPVDGLGESRSNGDGDAHLHTALKAAGTPYLHASDASQAIAKAGEILRPHDVIIVMSASHTARLAPALYDALQNQDANAAPEPDLAISYNTAPQLPSASSIIEALEYWRLNRPHRIAAECANQRLRYEELAARAKSLAQHLIGSGLRPGQTVATCMGRSLDRAIAFLGTMWAQGVFLPVDPSLPQQRIAFMLEDADASFVLTNSTGGDFGNATTVRLSDAVLGQTAELELSYPQAGQAAYIIYTSGTTGVPKGVAVDHGALANFAHCAARVFHMEPASRVSQVSAFGFDVSVGDIASTIVAGGTMIFPTDVQALPGTPMARFIVEKNVSHLSLTPSALMSLPAWQYPALRTIVVAGEACSPELVARWSGSRRFFNAYGPTEATILATFEECKAGTSVTIGHPFDNVGVCVLDDSMRVIPRGETGELCLFGSGLARGYLNRADLTASQFPVATLPGRGETRIYRTGDRASMGLDGRVIFWGRADHQVKIRGFRIELGEIEETLRRHPSIQDAAVIVDRSSGSNPKLIAYAVFRAPGAAPDLPALQTFLEDYLPNYMLPGQIIPIREMPLSANGKRDLAALPAPAQAPRLAAAKDRMAPRTRTEIALCEIYSNVLSLAEAPGTRDRLQDFGIDSLQAANLYMAIEDAFRVELDIDIFKDAETIELLGLHLDRLIGRMERESSATSPRDPEIEILRKQLGFLSAWDGDPCGPLGLARLRNGACSGHGFFWCFQGAEEHESLAEELYDMPVYGLRSGHLVFSYSTANVQSLAAIYASELISIQPDGPFYLGGNCQGGTIAQQTAIRLIEMGREVALLALVDPGRFIVYPGPTALIFGTESHLNPYRSIASPDRIFHAAFPAGYTVDLIPAGHGGYFSPPAKSQLAGCLRIRLESARQQAKDAPHSRPNIVAELARG